MSEQLRKVVALASIDFGQLHQLRSTLWLLQLVQHQVLAESVAMQVGRLFELRQLLEMKLLSNNAADHDRRIQQIHLTDEGQKPEARSATHQHPNETAQRSFSERRQ